MELSSLQRCVNGIKNISTKWILLKMKISNKLKLIFGKLKKELIDSPVFMSYEKKIFVCLKLLNIMINSKLK